MTIYCTAPTAVVVARTDGMSHSEWLGARRQGIGGSDAAAHPIDALEATEYAFCIIHEAPMHAGDRSCMHHRSAFEACTSVRMYIDADEYRAGRTARRTVNALADR